MRSVVKYIVADWLCAWGAGLQTASRHLINTGARWHAELKYHTKGNAR